MKKIFKVEVTILLALTKLLAQSHTKVWVKFHFYQKIFKLFSLQLPLSGDSKKHGQKLNTKLLLFFLKLCSVGRGGDGPKSGYALNIF